jgi:preprotein translocase subunit YajC
MKKSFMVRRIELIKSSRLSGYNVDQKAREVVMAEFIAFSVLVLILMGGYWSMVIFPKQRAFKKHNQYVRTLKPGDEVITFGGIIGTITSMDSEAGVAYVQIADNVEVRVLTAALARPFEPEDVALHSKVGVDPSAEARIRSRI